jgi:hypothetical protein
MERPQLETDSRLRYALEQYQVVLSLTEIGPATKIAWYVILGLSDFRFRKPLVLSGSQIAAKLHLDSSAGLRYLKELHALGLLQLFNKPDPKSRRPGANLWHTCLLDPSVDRDDQLQVIKADPQFLLAFAADADHVDGDAAAREGSREACATPSVALFTRPGHDAHLVESAQVLAMPAGLPAPAAELSPTSPQVSPEPPDLGPTSPQLALNTSSRLNQSSTSYFSGTSAPPNKLESKTREASSRGPGANFTPAKTSSRGDEPTTIGAGMTGLVGLVAHALTIDPIERQAKIHKTADWLRRQSLDVIRDPVNRLDPALAHRVAAAIVDGDLELRKVEAIFHNADRRAQAGTLKSRLGFTIGGFREVFRHARLDWRTGQKHPQ